MAIKLNSARVDLKREREGEWVDIPDWPGVRLKVRGFNYGPYIVAKNQVDLRNHRRYFSKQRDIPQDELFRTNGQLYLDHILLDWSGLDDDDGKPIPFSRAEEYLLDPAFRVLHDHIRYAGGLVGEVEIELSQDTAKNLSPSSAGSSSPENHDPNS